MTKETILYSSTETATSSDGVGTCEGSVANGGWRSLKDLGEITAATVYMSWQCHVGYILTSTCTKIETF
ncbi:hypothetical protein XENTR_v10002680 [Xenopus tropicalis]|nr:hypothetical protein XENTR_v10002680 [Xenopus tropicalis]